MTRKKKPLSRRQLRARRSAAIAKVAVEIADAGVARRCESKRFDQWQVALNGKPSPLPFMSQIETERLTLWVTEYTAAKIQEAMENVEGVR